MGNLITCNRLESEIFNVNACDYQRFHFFETVRDTLDNTK